MRQRRRTVTALAALAVGAGLLVPLLGADAADGLTGDGVYARVADGVLAVGNDLVERRFSLDQFRTLGITDKRTGELVAGTGPDAALTLVTSRGVQEVTLEAFDGGAPAYSASGSSLTVRVPLGPVDRVITVHKGVAGFSMSLVATAPLVVAGYALDEVAQTSPHQATTQAFHSGSDWREDGWKPQAALGDAQLGGWRTTTTIPAGTDRLLTGEWVSSGHVFQALERVDLASSTVGVQHGRTWAGADLTQDLVPLGPVEGDGHLGNPGVPTGRHRALLPGTALETVFTGVARDADDEGWQWSRYLHTARPSGTWDRGVAFNSDSVDSNKISTGAKDDMNLGEVRKQAAVAKQLGLDYFILDDGWQASSGDWCPDSPACPEPRGTAPRFPDSSFAAVREAIAPLKLGLWMSPMEFHPSAQAFKDNPEWVCAPLGFGTVGLNVAQDGQSSSEAGIGGWNPLALSPTNGRMIDYIEGRVARAIEQWDVRYFKFDFMFWIDCAGVQPADVYQYREAFTAMIDHLQAKHPHVVFQIDETNDYRLWPFESVTRGATWFQNGSPAPDALLHNLWSLAPYVPGDAIGQSPFSNGRSSYPTGTLAALTFLGHPTVKVDLTKGWAPGQVDEAARWIAAYHREIERFKGVTYPLLGDPAGGTSWAALQVWDRDQQSGVVAAFRQDAAADTATIALKGVDGSSSYRLRDLLTGEVVRTATADELRSGITVSGARRSVTVWVVEAV